MPFHVDRPRLRVLVERSLRENPITALLGPRQSGKTHLSRLMGAEPANCFDLENFSDLTRLQDDAMTALGRLSGLVIIDEVQRMPDLFPLLRVLADRPGLPARFLLLGSAAPQLVRGVSESLAGRVSFIDMGGLHLGEVDPADYERLWLRGGFPPAYLASELERSVKWRLDYVRTFIERDLRELADTKLGSADLRRLLLLLADAHGQPWNNSDAARILGVNYKTIQRHVDLLCGAFVLRELPAFLPNVRKRLRKAPKYYFRDSGLLHALLALPSAEHLYAHRGVGASWEGFAIEQIVRLLELRDEDCFNYAVQEGAEMDLVVRRPEGWVGFEFKASSAPRVTASIRQSMEDAGLSRVYVVYPGEKDFPLGENIDAVGIRNLRRLAGGGV